MDCLLETLEEQREAEKLLPAFSLVNDSLLKNAQILLEEDETESKIVISAVCCELTKRKAVCKIMMHFPDSYGGAGILKKKKHEPYILHVTYTVMAPKVLHKLYPPRLSPLSVEELIAAKLQSEALGVVASSSLVSPYAQIKGLPSHSFGTLSLSADRSYVKMGNSNIRKIPAEICAGHFEGNPTLPIAILATFCADLSGEAISVLIEKSLVFETNSVGPLAAVRRMNSDAGYYQHDAAGAGGSTLKFISAKVEALKLMQSNSDGISLVYEVVKEEDSNDGWSVSSGKNVYSSDISIFSADPTTDQAEEVLIGKMNMKFELWG